MNDLTNILTWFLGFFIIGAAFFPLTFSIFNSFEDKGYIFSKIIGLIFISYFVFLTGILHLLKFSQINVFIIIIIALVSNYSFSFYKKQHVLEIIRKNFKIFLAEEIILFITLLFWSYVRSNVPEIHGLEKFMDFGFLNSILRSDYFPPKDMWFTPLSINYYYFGHLATAVITKLTGIPSFITYNLMLSTIFAFTFTATLFLAINIFDDIRFSVKSALSGFFAAFFISFGGNLTTIYTFFKAYIPADKPILFWQLPFLPFSFPNGYWYPNATRFIPFTIHEFPLYSFVVSDLHGHVLDIPFVILTIAILFTYLKAKEVSFQKMLFLSFLFAVMYMTNAWDGLIYLLLGIIFLIYFIFYKHINMRGFSGQNFYKFLTHVITLVFGFFVFSLPFSIHFKPFVSGIGIICAPAFLTNLGKLGPFLFEADHCQRSPAWQLIILYGFFYFFVVSFILFLKFKKNYKFSLSDIFILMLIILSTILILIPEFIYIKDIYPAHYRANTMFKLTYEAFMMLSLSSAYILIKLFTSIKSWKIKLSFFLVSAAIVSLILVYPVFAINSYYRDLKTYSSLDGTKYLSTLYPADYDLINWININIWGQPVILEASGDSYTDYARISANTGLPTVLGWTVHEWLWRGTYEVAAPRISDVQTIYTSNDIDDVIDLIKKYNIKYIVVSGLEKQKYPNLNEALFIRLGKIVFEKDKTILYEINSQALR